MRRTRGIAPRLASALERLLGSPLPVRLEGWDGSQAGPEGAPLVVLRSRRALRRLLWGWGQLSAADAYVSGDVDIEGDVCEALRVTRAALDARGVSLSSIRRTDAARLLGILIWLGGVGRRPPPPSPRAHLDGELHTRARDRAAIRHHYDLSNAFYELLLDDTMSYSCAYWTSDDPDYGLADAQRDKLELICRKLAIEPGSRLLDLGCGWGSLSLYAAEEYQAQVTAVTLSAQQHAAVQQRVRDRGLSHLVDARLCDYRDAPDHGGYDAVASVEMGEHVGEAEYAAFAAALHRLLRPAGRLLVQQMSRGRSAPGGGPFIEAYIAPDMHMRPLGETVALLEDAGLEVRAVESLREHYARTIAAWRAVLESRLDEAVALVGEETARVWRLYLAGGILAFEQRRMGVDQIVGVRSSAQGASGMPSTLSGWYQREFSGERI
jgi:cyclopropane-fatty-acyl-phospholipid synthase